MNYLKTKFAKILVVLLSVCMLVGGAIVTVDAKVKESNASEYVATNEHDVMLEVQKGSSWMQSNGKNVQVKSIKNKKAYNYEVQPFRIVNNEDYAVEVNVSLVSNELRKNVRSAVAWTYTKAEETGSLEELNVVIEANSVSETLSVSGYLNAVGATKIRVTDVMLSAEKVRAPYYTINTDVDLNIDENGKTIVLDDDAQNYLASVNGQKITLSNATITGHTVAVMLGQYRSPSYSTFNNELNNVTIRDLEVTNGVYNHKDTISNGVYAYGNTVLNNCTMQGTTSVAEGFNVYDIGFVNKSVSTINGGTYGSIYVWSQAHLTINNATVDTIDCATITTRNLGMLTIGAGTHVGTINLTTAGYSQYKPALTIQEGAIVDEIIYNGTTYTQYEWNSPFYGKTISIMGDSISTYTGWSDVNPITDPSCTNRYGEAYYGPVGGDFHNTDMLVSDTWWHQAATQLGASILMNNSGNSSGILYASSSNAAWDLYLKEMLAWKSRPYYLGKDGKNPDIIALYIGSNEARNKKCITDKGSLEDTLNKGLVKENEDGTFTYGTPVTITDAYFILMHKVTVTYPDAEVYCFLPTPQAGGELSTFNIRVNSTKVFNETILAVADYYGAIKVDLYDAFNIDSDKNGVALQEDYDIYNTYFHNDPHPKASGFDVITKCFVDAVLKNSKYNK